MHHSPTNKQLAAKAKEIILADLGIYHTLRSLAHELGTNVSKLKVIFPQYHGESVFIFSRRMRVEKAKELLAQTNCTLQVIAETLGYSEGNNFQATFKKVTGMTPGEYRRKEQE